VASQSIRPVVPPDRPLAQVFGVGLALGLWLYSGYEQLSSVAEEVENPQRTFPRALAVVVPLSIVTYFLPTFAALASVDNWQNWKDGYFSIAAQQIGGPWLGSLMTVGAMVGIMALLNSTVPNQHTYAVHAGRRRLPSPFFSRVNNPRYGTPWIAILLSAAIYASLAMHT